MAEACWVDLSLSSPGERSRASYSSYSYSLSSSCSLSSMGMIFFCSLPMRSAGYFLMYISCISFNAFDLLIFRIIFFYFKLKNILGFSFSSIKLWSISIVISSDSSLLELDFLTSSCTMVSCSISSSSVSVTELN